MGIILFYHPTKHYTISLDSQNKAIREAKGDWLPEASFQFTSRLNAIYELNKKGYEIMEVIYG